MAEAESTLNQSLQQERKRRLIDATISTITQHGLSGLTLAKVAAHLGMTAGSISFHFESKESLLIETLRYVAEEFETAIRDAVQQCSGDAGEKLCRLIETNLDEKVSETRRVTVWYAFLAETRSRRDYQRICGSRDEAYYRRIRALCKEIVDDAGRQHEVDAGVLADGLAGILDGFWSDILFKGDGFDRRAARQRCMLYLANVFPWRFDAKTGPKSHDMDPDLEEAPPGESTDLVYTLPAWVYSSERFFQLEKEQVFMPAWQLVCHTSDLPVAGAYVRYDMFNERAFVVRDREGHIRAFQNVCAHRAHTLVQEERGECPGKLTCPYHGWTYALDGQRIGIGAPERFGVHDKTRFGLKSLEVEIYLGFVFIRYRCEGPSVVECFGPVAEEFRAYRTEDMQPLVSNAYGNPGFWTEVVDIDWKNGLENYVEDYHFPTGHRGLSALMEADYAREPMANGVCRLSHRMKDRVSGNWSAARYRSLLPEYPHLPAAMRDRWSYYALYPNTFFDLFPEQMDFMQMVPIAPGRMRLRGRNYGLPDSSAKTRAVRYLGDRINMRVQDEDNFLTGEVQKGLATSGYQRGILSDREILVRHFQDWLREKLPCARYLHEPEKL